MNWEWKQEWGEPGQMGPVRSDVGRIEIKAKDLSLRSNFGPESENGQWNNKGLFADNSKTPGILDVEVSGTINLETGHFPIFADPGSITITGFKELKAEATGRMDGSGYVVRNVTVDGKPSTIQITSTPDSKISLLSKKSYRSDGKQTAVVEDGSPQGQGTLIQGGNISIVREAEEEHSIVMTAHSYTEGHIDIKGAQAVTIGTPERKREFAVQGFSKGNGFSTININQPSKGQVIINGSVAAESAEVNINYAGKDSRQNGEVLAAKSHLDSEKEFTLNGTV